jgi:serine/threonine protein phosphatase PrpC
MEDSHFVSLSQTEEQKSKFDAFFGVYDGHGGRRAADYVSENVYKSFLEILGVETPVENALHQSLLDIESRFLKLATQDHLPDGTTVAIAVIQGNNLIVANIGDSEIVLCRGTKAIPLTILHNPQKNPDEKERIVSSGGRLYHDRLAHPVLNPAFFNIAVSRSIGDIFFKHSDYVKDKEPLLIPEPSVAKCILTPEDLFLVLACDGLFDVMSYQEIMDYILEKEKEGMNEIAKGLIDLAYERGSSDNITVLVVDLR